jgi:resuscitation-promoting factor RpfB
MVRAVELPPRPMAPAQGASETGAWSSRLRDRRGDRGPVPEPTPSIGRWLVPVLVSAVLTGVLVWLQARPTGMQVRVEGQQLVIDSGTWTVGALLTNRGLVVGPYDAVQPGLTTEVTDGLAIDIVRAHPLTLDDNGVTSTIWTTGTTVDAVLVQLDRSPDDVQPPRGSTLVPGSVLTIRDSKSVVVNADGQQEFVVQTGRTVGDVLATAGIVLDADDEVTPPPATPIANGDTVNVVRWVTHEVTEDTPIPNAVQQRNDASIARGKEVVVQAGQTGLIRTTSQVTTRDGIEVRRTFLSEQRVREPVDRIVAIGTRAPVVATPSPPAAPAATVVTSPAPPSVNGQYVLRDPPVGLEPGSQSGLATWYEAPVAGGCAHRTLPKGTRVVVTDTRTGASAGCIVNDRGPFGAGRIIDLSPDVFQQLGHLDAGVISVTISW